MSTNVSNNRIFLLIAGAVIIALALAQFGLEVYALLWILLSTILLLSQVEHAGSTAKIGLTASLGVVGMFIFISKWGIPGLKEGEDMFHALEVLAHTIHLDIFVFLAGLYMVVNTFAYSGLIGDMAWKIVKRAQGKLGIIMVAIMVLTCILSGIFDGATIASIMGVVTLTILLSSGMQVKHILKILLLLVVATNIGGVWFVLGEPTNILAAAKLGLSPFYFLAYAAPFAIPAMFLTAFAAWRIVKKYQRIHADRPEIEVLLEGISLRRTHSGAGTLVETLQSTGNVELRHLKAMERIIDEEGIPDFEAALKVGIPQERVYDALSINLNSEDLALGLIEYYLLREKGDPMAEILIGDLLHHVKDEYKSRTQSRRLVIVSGVILIALLILHAFIPAIPTWLGTVVAGIVAILAVQKNARKFVLQQTWHHVVEAFFLVAIFATISEINHTGTFESLGGSFLNAASVPIIGVVILAGSAVLSAVADNIAVMDVLTNIIAHHTDWSFFALASIVGTALGGFASPIASVQAVILAGVIRRVARVSFGSWIKMTAVWFVILLVVSVVILVAFYYLGLPPEMPLPTLRGGAH